MLLIDWDWSGNSHASAPSLSGSIQNALPPFEARVLPGGEALLHASQPLDCERRRSYKLRLQAQGCSGAKSLNASLHVTVEDVNEHAPQFRQSSYSVRVRENAPPSSLVRLHALDRDCSAKFSEICKFELIGGDRPDTPFVLDPTGELRNIRPLSISRDGARHLLEVVAYDCGMRRSRPALVTVNVQPACQPVWSANSLNSKLILNGISTF